VFTLHDHVGAERGNRSRVTRQAFKTRLKNAPVLGRDGAPALMSEPDFHPGELPKQCAELFENPVA